jgi:hypothetical protein
MLIHRMEGVAIQIATGYFGFLAVRFAPQLLAPRGCGKAHIGQG